MKKFISTLFIIFLLISFASGDGFVITNIKNSLSEGFVITEVVEEESIEAEIKNLEKELFDINIKKKEIETRINLLKNISISKQIKKPWIGPLGGKDESLQNVEWKHERVKTGCVNGVCYFADKWWFRSNE
jgi:hypothetical protein